MSRTKQHDKLKSFVDRLVNLADQRQGLAEDAKEVLLDAELAGFNKRAVRQIVKEQRLDPTAFEAHKLVWETVEEYREQLGMLRGTALGDAAERARDKMN